MTVARLEGRQVAAIARKELRERLRSRWVLAVAAVFTLFALVIAYFGAAQQGAVGFKGIELTIASLVSLAIYLVPLIALILGYDAIVGERERGSLDLLLSLPITRVELLIGKYLGLAAALAVSTLAGFGLVGVLIVAQGGLVALFHYSGFMLSAILMGMAFLSLAVLVSVLAASKTAASGAAIALWFVFVLVYDLILLGVLVLTEGALPGALVSGLLLLNPADVFRVLNVFSLEEVKTFYGLATVASDTLTAPWLLGAVMGAWIVAPLALALIRFRAP
ncbi:MAG: ABC transporter permease [Gammaproteobacteria bacterium]|nr:MAG: ABC transporter permease [Gammaproteobacteria bacterium]